MPDFERARLSLERIKETAKQFPVVSILLEDKKPPTPTNIRSVVEQITNGTHEKASVIDFLVRNGHKVQIAPSAGQLVAHVETKPKEGRKYKKTAAIIAVAVTVGGAIIAGSYELICHSRKRARRIQQKKIQPNNSNR